MSHHRMKHFWLVTEAKVPQVFILKSLLFVVPEDNEKKLSKNSNFLVLPCIILTHIWQTSKT